MFRSRIARIRPVVAATVVSGILAILTSAVALAGGGGGPWPR